MAGKYMLRVVVLHIGIITVNSQLDLLFGGGGGLGGGLFDGAGGELGGGPGLGGGLGGGLFDGAGGGLGGGPGLGGGLGGGLFDGAGGGLGGGPGLGGGLGGGLFDGAGSGLGGGPGLGGGFGGNGGFGNTAVSSGGGLGGFGGVGGGVGGGGSGGGRRFYGRSRLNRVVQNIVHPNARATQAMSDIARRHRGAPETPAEQMEYIPHFTQLALDMGVTHPNVTGVPTFKQMEAFMTQKAAAYRNSTSSSRRAGNSRSSASGSAGVSGTNTYGNYGSNSAPVTNPPGFDPWGHNGVTYSPLPLPNSEPFDPLADYGSPSGAGSLTNTQPFQPFDPWGNNGLADSPGTVAGNSWNSGSSNPVESTGPADNSSYVDPNTAMNDPFLDQFMMFQFLSMNNNFNI